MLVFVLVLVLELVLVLVLLLVLVPVTTVPQVPIKSLPQEWLWCETWCSKETLKDAKSIDLCNNPLTKVTHLNIHILRNTFTHLL